MWPLGEKTGILFLIRMRSFKKHSRENVCCARKHFQLIRKGEFFMDVYMDAFIITTVLLSKDRTCLNVLNAFILFIFQKCWQTDVLNVKTKEKCKINCIVVKDVQYLLAMRHDFRDNCS